MRADKPRPIPLKDRVSLLFVEKCRVDVVDGAFVLIGKEEIRTQVPLGGVTCVMLEPGVRISHAAVKLAAEVGTLLVWVGEAGVRLYSCGQPGGARSDKLLFQAQLALDDGLRLKVVRKMYEVRFGERPPERRSVEQLRGIEGARVKKMYEFIARGCGVRWKGRRYNPAHWDYGDRVNRALSCATSCLYGLCEAAILAAGYAPAVGFIHTGKAKSFVYDIADLYKFDTVVPIAFRHAKHAVNGLERSVRIACRDSFRKTRLLERIIPGIESILASAGIEPPAAPEEAVLPAIPPTEGIGDAGHRNE